jgi:hypothetical protein
VQISTANIPRAAHHGHIVPGPYCRGRSWRHTQPHQHQPARWSPRAYSPRPVLLGTILTPATLLVPAIATNISPLHAHQGHIALGPYYRDRSWCRHPTPPTSAHPPRAHSPPPVLPGPILAPATLLVPAIATNISPLGAHQGHIALDPYYRDRSWRHTQPHQHQPARCLPRAHSPPPVLLGTILAPATLLVPAIATNISPPDAYQGHIALDPYYRDRSWCRGQPSNISPPTTHEGHIAPDAN